MVTDFDHVGLYLSSRPDLVPAPPLCAPGIRITGVRTSSTPRARRPPSEIAGLFRPDSGELLRRRPPLFAQDAIKLGRGEACS
jgi:hypothetical protein